MVRRRPGEGDDEYRERDRTARRERYARQKAEGRVPTDLLKLRRYAAERKANRTKENRK